MQLDKWLDQVYEEECLTKESEALFEKMSPEDLLDIAVGASSVEKVAALGLGKLISDDVKSGEMKKRVKRNTRTLTKIMRGQPTTFRERMGMKPKQAEAKLAFMDKVARQIARMHVEEAEKTAVVGPLIDAANLGIPSAIGYSMGRSEGRGMAMTGEKMDRPSIAGALMVPGALGYRYGKTKAYKATKKALKKRRAEKEMTKQDEFSTPEAKAKAQVMSRAMKATKNAPMKVRKGAIKAVAKKI